MLSDREILANRVRERIDALGKSPREISIAATGKPDLVRDIYRHKRMPTGPVLHALAQALETTTDHLLGKADSALQPVSEVSFREPPMPWGAPPPEGIPLIGSGFCDDLAIQDEDGGEFEVERVMLEADHVIRMITRPPALVGARDAYAIYYHGSSMEPRFRQGDVGVVDPRRPAAPGDDVVVQLRNSDGTEDVMTVLVKELVRATGSYVELRQFNPQRVFRIPRARVAHLHRIVPIAELLGV